MSPRHDQVQASASSRPGPVALALASEPFPADFPMHTQMHRAIAEARLLDNARLIEAAMARLGIDPACLDPVASGPAPAPAGTGP